jgi:hypothetical protein
MATKRIEVLDDEGNVIAPPGPETPVGQIVWLLEYARQRDFQIPMVQVGDTIVTVTDLRQARVQKSNGKQPDLQPGSDMALVLGAVDQD